MNQRRLERSGADGCKQTQKSRALQNCGERLHMNRSLPLLSNLAACRGSFPERTLLGLQAWAGRGVLPLGSLLYKEGRESGLNQYFIYLGL